MIEFSYSKIGNLSGFAATDLVLGLLVLLAVYTRRQHQADNLRA